MSDPDVRIQHDGEEHDSGHNDRLNWLRAGVLGANDGIVSVAGLVVGVAGATTNQGTLLTAGIAGMVAGAVSMALGEYVSVSSQRDAERDLIAKEKLELHEDPEAELAELAAIYEKKGLHPTTAHQVAQELTEHDVLAAHLDAELGIDPDDLTNPINAAIASAIAFTIGAALPLAAILLPPPAWRAVTTFVVVLIALAITGYVSAAIGGGSRPRATLRLVVGGAVAMAATYGIGTLFNTPVS
ncbi:VIT1/CCC1 family predicted Fe2+/Mn2+ transporter [Antricoccus suffuscus]|uniref:VIT1/CCC1 family predicted Fe2+/Mn2+ transporter n=2 Tax=Antricoccus suffuscus TaxID=1629062 RepID=A0A2T1A0D2_9ACTN|nr:VIT1/CCC1 family predicted Fe2+/Mn2+ transporter [Antricoccus suffuscus]